MKGLGTATKHSCVTRLQAERCGIGCDVRARLVDDADDTKRNAHAPDLDAGRTIVHVENLADRVRQAGNLAQSLDHRIDTGRIEFETIEQGRIQPFLPAGFEILQVLAHEGITVRIEIVGDRIECRVLLCRWRCSKQARGRPCFRTGLLHVGSDIADRLLNCLFHEGRLLKRLTINNNTGFEVCVFLTSRKGLKYTGPAGFSLSG